MSCNDLDASAQPAKLRSHRACKFKATIYGSQKISIAHVNRCFRRAVCCATRDLSFISSPVSATRRFALCAATIAQLSATRLSSHSHRRIGHRVTGRMQSAASRKPLTETLTDRSDD